MARKSGENGGVPASDGPTRAQLREINQRMAAQFLARDPQPLVEGGYAVRVLDTRGRRSGLPRRTPLGVTLVGGGRYVVSPDVRRDWVGNLAAEPDCALLGGDGSELCRAVPMTGNEAATAVATYLSTLRVPWALQAFPIGPDASREEISAHLDAIAVFRLDPPNDPAQGVV